MSATDDPRDVTDAELFGSLRRLWATVDPVPGDLSDRMIAAVAARDLAAEYIMLTLVEADKSTAVRADTDRLPLQFSDGATTVLVHAAETESGARRLDGWIDGDTSSVQLIQDAGSWTTTVTDGRFAFDSVPAGLSALRIEIRTPEDRRSVLMTPRFEI